MRESTDLRQMSQGGSGYVSMACMAPARQSEGPVVATGAEGLVGYTASQVGRLTD